MSQLSKKESLLPRSFFKTPTGEDDHEMKIAFIWSRIPDAYKREMQRQGSFQSVKTWSDFERGMLNAESACKPLGGATSSRQGAGNGSGRGNGGKRPGYQSDRESKRLDRKSSNNSNRASPSRGDDALKGNRYQGSGRGRGSYSRGGYVGRQENRRDDRDERRDAHDDRRDNRQNQGDRRGGNQGDEKVNDRKPHWKTEKSNSNSNSGKSDNSGKANP
jgi:hypothetical protein